MNCSASLSSVVCIVSACFACAAGAQTFPATPAFASSSPLAPVPLQRSAQAAITAITGAAAEPATAASDVASPTAVLPAALPAASTAAAPESRGRGALRRPLVPTRPHRPSVADAPTEDLWHTGTLYASPYEKSPYTQPGDPE